MPALRICHVCCGFPPSIGGIETFVYNVAKRQVKRGHEVVVVTSDRGRRGGGLDVADGIKIARSREYNYFFEVPIAPGVLWSLLRLEFDVLHVHGMTPIQSDLAVRIGKLRKRPVVLTYHFDAETKGVIGRILAVAYLLLANRTLRSVDAISATSRHYAETSSLLRRFIRSITITQPAPGFELGESPDLAAEGRSGKSGSDTLLLFVGQLKYYKGVDVLLRAFSLVLQTRTDPRLMIVGDGPEKDRLIKLASRLGILSKTRFSGFISKPELAEAYRCADIFVFPSFSRREALGIALMEAMAFGKAVVSTKISGPDGLVQDKKNGILINPSDEKALAEAILDLLADGEKRRRLGEEAQRSVRGLSWEHVVSQFDTLYRV